MRFGTPYSTTSILLTPGSNMAATCIARHSGNPPGVHLSGCFSTFIYLAIHNIVVSCLHRHPPPPPRPPPQTPRAPSKVPSQTLRDTSASVVHLLFCTLCNHFIDCKVLRDPSSSPGLFPGLGQLCLPCFFCRRNLFHVQTPGTGNTSG